MSRMTSVIGHPLRFDNGIRDSHVNDTFDSIDQEFSRLYAKLTAGHMNPEPISERLQRELAQIYVKFMKEANTGKHASEEVD